MANYETTNTQCEELIIEASEDSYKTSAFGMEFFNVERCNKDIDEVRANIKQTMLLMERALECLDEAQACLDKSSGISGGALVAIDSENLIKFDAEHLLNAAQFATQLAEGASMKSSDNMLNVILKLRATCVAPDINDEDDNCEWA